MIPTIAVRVRVGELITFVKKLYGNLGARLVGCEVIEFSPGSAVSALVAFPIQALLNPEKEGIEWIRGWFSRETEEGQALLAAYALTLGETQTPRGPTGATGPLVPRVSPASTGPSLRP